MKQEIQNILKEIEEREQVTIIMAVESGSRAWGFASADSDYDVRFLYIRKLRDYLKLEGTRDVIEWQLDETLDINGWDLQKALRLLKKSNPAVIEWCASPIFYRQSDASQGFCQLAQDYFSPKKGMYHYYHMAKANQQALNGKEQVRVKSYFYVLRPVLAARWIMERKSAPPVPFQQLVADQLEPRLIPVVDQLIEMKSKEPETAVTGQIPQINQYIEEQLKEIERALEVMEEDGRQGYDELNRFFYESLGV